MENDNKPSGKDQKYTEKDMRKAATGSNKNGKPDTNNTNHGSKGGEINMFKIAEFVLLILVFAATATAAVYTRKQWITADDVEYRSLRASVILNDLEIVPAALNGTLIGYMVVPKWHNVGETSATGLTFRISTQFSRDDLPLGFTEIDNPALLEGPADVAPKETLNVGGMRDPSGVPFYYPQSCLLDMQQDKFRYSYVWGWAKYHDIFRPNVLRTTRFCRRVYGTYLLHNELAFNQYLCQEGNCQDEACEKYDALPQPRMPALEMCQPLKIPLGAGPQAPAHATPPAAAQTPEPAK